jgi:hypothetical protein
VTYRKALNITCVNCVSGESVNENNKSVRTCSQQTGCAGSLLDFEQRKKGDPQRDVGVSFTDAGGGLMRAKEAIMKEVSSACDSGENEYLFLEVLIDIRDQLTTMNNPKKLEEQAETLKELFESYGKLFDKIRSNV